MFNFFERTQFSYFYQDQMTQISIFNVSKVYIFKEKLFIDKSNSAFTLLGDWVYEFRHQ